MSRTAGLLLAAGQGRRAGGPKALRADADGTSWAVRAVRALREGGCTDVHVVVGAAGQDVREALADENVRVVEATDWARGMGASLNAGLAALADRPVDVACVHLVDLPDVGADVVRRLLDSDGGADTLVRAAYGHRPGHPVLIGRAHWPAVAATAHDDTGARDYLAQRAVRFVDCSDLAGGADVDGPAGLPSASPATTEVPGA
uniref:Molybdenum cofactor cytidylyltransferase n=1 Tax=uncultured Nocardioidaceae bacterium TaxID=253824 RepID=A0A6J4L6E1_9ACTN|nr:MAG: Molybdenum cofactor cytidylyltransferase [uncultured Nocardioidaceae bacterium]